MPRAPNPRSEKITISVTPELKSALEIEAWEERRTLSAYVEGLLVRRGKWARTVGNEGGYDIAMPPKESDAPG